MANTPNLDLPLLSASQAQKHVTHNEALRVIDALLRTRILDKDLATPPGSPSDGDMYIVASSATGDWAGQEKDVAYYDTNAWAFLTPVAGQLVYITDEAKTYQYDGTNWAEFSAGGGGGGGSSAWDAPSLETDYSGVGDDSTNNTTAINDAMASGEATYVPHGVFKTTTIAPTSLTTRFWGDGQLRTSDNNKRGRYFSQVDAAPASEGNRDSIGTAFNGDMSGVQFPVEHRITGAATAGQPTTGYKYTHEVQPHYTHMRNESGHNQSTTGNGGRTGIAAYMTKVDHVGQGDAVAYNALVFINSTKSGSTDFLANPAGVMLNGTISAGQDGCYLNTTEFDMQDNGNDIAGIATVSNLSRTVGTGAKNAIWMGHRVQSLGSVDVDAGLSFSGAGGFKVGIDFTPAILDGAQPAICMKSGQSIYFNSTAGTWYKASNGGERVYYNGSSMVVAAGNVGIIQARSSQCDIAPSGSIKFRADTSGATVVSDFKVASSVGGSNYFRARSAEVNCSVQLKVNGILDIYNATTSSSKSFAGFYARIRINGGDYYFPAYS